MTPEQLKALSQLVSYVLETEEKHHEEALLEAGIVPDDSDPYGLKALPDFPHVFRAALALKEFAD
jgi:hypothetical protein